MRKWIVGAVLVLLAAGVAFWLSLDRDQRAVIANMPTDRDVLFWPVETRDAAFRALDAFPVLAGSNTIAAGGAAYPLPEGEPLDLGGFDLEAFERQQRSAAIVVVLDGEIVLERYGLDFGPEGKWTSFSVAKSFTSTLVGAALQDGYIESLDEPVTRYVPELAGSGYDGVSIRQVLTMSSGTRWNEDYSDPQSDVAQFDGVEFPDGGDATVAYLRTLPREAEPRTRWHYNTGETNLIGVLVRRASGKSVAEYLSEKVWRPFGMERDASWLLGRDGFEISGCCIQATTRDFARFGMFAMGGGVADGKRVVPQGWFAEATQPRFETGGNRHGRGYGYQWWTYEDGAYAASGLFGQGIFVDPARRLVIASNANWLDGNGAERSAANRNRFYSAVQAAVDRRRADQIPR